MRAVAVVLLLALPAGADVELGGRPGLRLSAGYDDNLFLDPQLSTANPAPRADAIIDVAPRLFGWLGWRRHLFTLSADYLERVTPSNGDLRDANLSLGWQGPRWGRVSLSMAARYEHWATDFYPEDTFDLGGLEGAVRVQLHERVALEALYRYAARSYPHPSRNQQPDPAQPSNQQLDQDQRAGGQLYVRAAPWLRLQAGYTFLHLGSNSRSAELERHRAEVSLEVTPLPQLSISAGYAVAWQHLDHALIDHGMGMNPPKEAARSDLLQWLDMAVVARPLPWLELFARYQFLDARTLASATDVQASGTYRRNQVLAGAGLRWDFARLYTSHRPLAPAVSGTSVTFRHRAPPGSRVEVVGDWAGWAPQALVERSAGVYEATYTLPPGRHEYGFLVDGKAVEPAEAPAYVPDGFGGRSGVITVE